MAKLGGQYLHQRMSGVEARHRVAIGHAVRLQAFVERACTADAVLHRRNQVARPHRLENEIIAPLVEHFQLALGILIAGQEHNRGVRKLRVLANLRGQRGATGAGHMQIHQHQIGDEALQCFHHALGNGDHLRLHPGTAQNGFGKHRLAAVILDNQDAIRVAVRHGGRKYAAHSPISPWFATVAYSGLAVAIAGASTNFAALAIAVQVCPGVSIQ